jgi:hypothetical protein
MQRFDMNVLKCLSTIFCINVNVRQITEDIFVKRDYDGYYRYSDFCNPKCMAYPTNSQIRDDRLSRWYSEMLNFLKTSFLIII